MATDASTSTTCFDSAAMDAIYGYVSYGAEVAVEVLDFDNRVGRERSRWFAP